MDGPFRRRQQNIQDLQNTYLEIKNNPVEWTAKNISIPNTQSMNDNAARGIPIPSNVFVSFDTVDTSLATGVGREQVKYLVENNFDLNKLSENIKPVAVKYKLTDQILNQGTSGKWTGMGFGTPEKNALAMADMLSGAGITDIKQFGVLPDGKYGNKTTGQAIDANYTRAGGNIWGGTFEGANSTGFGVQFGPDGTPYFYTQEGASTSDMGKIAPIISLGLTFFAPGIGTAIGTALGATGTAATVIGSAIVQGTLSEIQGGDFLDGAIKGAVTAGVAPVVANTVGTTVADLMGDSAFKSVVSNAIASSASSAVSAALTGGDVGQAALTGALAGAGGSVGRELGTAAEYGTTPFTEQTQMLAGQEQGLGGAGGLGANLGQAAGAVAAGDDPTQAIINAIIQTQQEKSAATPDTADQVSPETPVSPPPGAEITTAPPPETGQISDVGLMDGIAGTIPEIDTPSTQEITIPDQITQELGGVQEGIAETIPTLDQELINLITQAQPELAPVQEVVVPPVEDIIPGVQEGIAETIPEDLGVQTGIVETIPEDFGIQQGVAEGIPTEAEIAELANPALDVLGQPLTPESVDIEPIPQDPLLGLSAPSVGEGEQEAIDYQALEGLSSADVGLGEEQAIDQANLDALADLSSAEVGEGEQEAIDQANLDALADLSSAEVGLGEQEAINRQALEELSSAEVGLGEQQAIEDSFPRIDTTPYIRDTYLSLGRKRPDFGPTVTTLGQALQAPFFPTSPVSGLTSYRGAGEIEGQRTGKPRRNVWNESSLRLTDALGL
jgi:hypothetical protein